MRLIPKAFGKREEEIRGYIGSEVSKGRKKGERADIESIC
jgi:hypothetical protein